MAGCEQQQWRSTQLRKGTESTDLGGEFRRFRNQYRLYGKTWWLEGKAHAEEPSHVAMDDTRALFRPEEVLLFTAYPDCVRHR